MREQLSLNEHEQKIIANVNSHGCHINFVVDPDGELPSFGYSVGFPSTVSQPEVIVFGLSSDLTFWMINETLRQCRGGLQLLEGARIEGLLENHSCIARCVCASSIVPEHLNSAIWYHRYRTGEELSRAVQLVWPGAIDGLFPWDSGCDPSVSFWQPALYKERLDS